MIWLMMDLQQVAAAEIEMAFTIGIVAGCDMGLYFAEITQFLPDSACFLSQGLLQFLFRRVG